MTAAEIERELLALAPPGNAGCRGEIGGVPVRRFAAHYEIGRGRRAFDLPTAVECVAAELSRPESGEYLALDLDANNRRPPGTLGWGVCRHGHGLQDLPPLTEEQAERIADYLNRERQRDAV